MIKIDYLLAFISEDLTLEKILGHAETPMKNTFEKAGFSSTHFFVNMSQYITIIVLLVILLVVMKLFSYIPVCKKLMITRINSIIK